MKYLTFVSAVVLCSISYATPSTPCLYEATMIYAANPELHSVQVNLLVEGYGNPHLERKAVDIYLAETCIDEISMNQEVDAERLACNQITEKRPTDLTWFAVDYSQSFSMAIEDSKELLGLDQNCRIQYKKKTYLYQNLAD